MFRFKQFLLILENRVAFLKGQQNPELHDTIDHYATNADPTEGKEYTSKLLAWHKAGQIKPEDHTWLKDLLTDFHQQKQKLQKRDIGAYKTPSELEDAVSGYSGSMSGKAREEHIKKEETEHVYKENKVSIVSPKTEASACLYGANTTWCTTWTGTHPNGAPKNMFKHYNDQGPLYIMNTPSGKYQYHPASGEFKNAADDEINPSSLAMKHPEVAHGLKQIGVGKNIVTNRAELEAKLNSNDVGAKESLIKEHPLVTPEDITKILNNPNEADSVKKAATEHPTAFTKEHLDKLFEHLPETSNFFRRQDHEDLLQHALESSSAVTETHVNSILNSSDDEVPSSRKHAVLLNKNKGVIQSHHIDKILEGDDAELRETAMKSPAVEPHHIDRVLRDYNEHDDVKMSAVYNPALTSKQAKRVLSGNNDRLKGAVIRHPTAIGPEDIDKYLTESNVSGYTKRHLLDNSPAIRPHHIDMMVNDFILNNKNDISVPKAALKNKIATPENIDNLMSESNKRAASKDRDASHSYEELKRHTFQYSPAIRPHHIDALLDDHEHHYENEFTIDAALRHPTAVEPHHIDKILADKSLSDDHLSAVLKSPALTSEHIGKILKDPDIYDSTKEVLLSHPKLLPSHVDYVLNNPDMEHSLKVKALEHPTAVRSRHIDELLSDPYSRGSLQANAVYHPNAMKPRHIDKILDNPDDYSSFVIRGALNQFSPAKAVQPRHISQILHNPDKYDSDVLDAAANHPVTKQMAATNYTPSTT
jgi:hemoglobin-like flavoprotein